MKEILSDLKSIKLRNISNPKSSDFSVQLKSLIGKSFDETEINNLFETKDNEFEDLIKKKFEEKRAERQKILGLDQSLEIEKRIFLQLIDQNWKLHIQYLEQLRQVIGLRSYGQRDPLVEYKKEAFQLFENLLRKLKSDLITVLFNIKVLENPKEDVPRDNKSKKFSELTKNKIGRNEPCPCNSGKKYKHCCGAL